MNKKYPIIFICFCLFVLNSLGQDEKPFSFFIQGGLNASQVGGDGLQGFDKLNAAVGIGVSKEISEKFDWQLEIDLLQKGSRKVADPDNGDFTEYKMELLYAQVPVLFEYKHNEKFSLLFGPGIGFLLSSEETNLLGEVQNTPDFNSLDLSLILSLKYSLSPRFGTEIRYDQSILPIRTRGDLEVPLVLGSQFNTVLGLFLSYTIN